MAYFDCQIVQGGGGVILTVTCYSVFAGTTITATDGETTLQAICPSSSPYEVQFNIPNAGTWTISGAYNGETYSIQVVIPSSATLAPIPNGSTTTPTDVIQTWLHCADIWDKNYTTIAQVLADAATVIALIASNNAVDYMARSTSWASNVTANASAMTIIGANNYCADKLLQDSTWLNAICNSTYFESVLNVKVPTMTSDTTPSGTVIHSNVYQQYYGWRPFAQSASTTLIGDNQSFYSAGSGDKYDGYDFGKEVRICRVDAKYCHLAGATTNSNTFKLQYSSDLDTWEDIPDSSRTVSTTNPQYNQISLSAMQKVICNHKARAIRSFVITSNTPSWAYMQIYAREDV